MYLKDIVKLNTLKCHLLDYVVKGLKTFGVLNAYTFQVHRRSKNVIIN